MKARRDSCSPLTRSLISKIFEGMGLADSTVAVAFREGRYGEVVNIETDVSDPDVYFVSELLSKFPFDTGIDRQQVAIDKFLDVEMNLRVSDVNLMDFLSGRNNHRPDLWWVHHLAKRKIGNLLSDFCWSSCERFFGFGPGATIGLPRRVAQGPNKYGFEKPSVTPLCLDLAVAAVCSNSAWRDFHVSVNGLDPEQWFTIVPGNKVVTVPKNAKTDRTIAIEPQMNMYIQKGIGGVIRSRLRRVGVDLNDQSLNQALALKGSLSGDLATIDLSSASDSISLRLVEELLPPDWFAAIEMCRSPYGVLLDGTRKEYRKVSSMGNGFTFELESLIFWAACSAVVEFLELSDRTIGVYGDDLIVPVSAVGLLLEVLKLWGFTPNAKKTHVSGPFRESCGKHYLEGCDVTPVYIRENVDTPERLIWFANSIKAYAFRRMGSQWGLDGRFQLSWEHALASSRRALPLGPLWLNGQLSTSCVGVDFDRALPAVKRGEHGLEGFTFPIRRRLINDAVFDGPGSLIGTLDVHGRDPFRGWGEFSRVSREGKWIRSNGFTRQWLDVGPWLPCG